MASINGDLYDFPPVRKALERARDIVNDWLENHVEDEDKAAVVRQAASPGWPAVGLAEGIALALLEGLGFDIAEIEVVDSLPDFMARLDEIVTEHDERKWDAIEALWREVFPESEPES